MDGHTLAYSAYARDSQIHTQSSSGGIFSLIAEQILNENGVVYGAAFDDNWNVCHLRVNNLADLHLLRGSKYMQSNLGDTFKSIRKDLKAGLKVLFCGTPCQVNGLLSYVGKIWSKELLTVDFACHGVPSTKIWDKYIGDKSKIKNVSFRNKKYGWKAYSVKIDYEDNICSSIFTRNHYMQAFIRDFTLRPSCYQCKAKGVNRPSDITLADFWGVSSCDPKMNHLLGVSLLLVHTEKGLSLLKNLTTEDIVMHEENLEQAIRMNPSIVASSSKPEFRDDLMTNIESMSFEQLYRKYVSCSWKKELKSYIKSCAKVCLYYLNRLGITNKN